MHLRPSASPMHAFPFSSYKLSTIALLVYPRYVREFFDLCNLKQTLQSPMAALGRVAPSQIEAPPAVK